MPSKYRIFHSIKLVVTCAAILFAAGCAHQKDRLNDQHIITEKPPFATIRYNSIQARHTDKGLQINGSLRGRISWPGLKIKHVHIEVLSADEQLLEKVTATIRKHRGRGLSKNLYNFSKFIPGTFSKDISLNIALQTDLSSCVTIVNPTL